VNFVNRHLEPALAHALSGNVHVGTAPAGHRIFSRGAPCNHFLVVLEGGVRVQVTSSSGREIVLYRLHPGETCVMTTSCLLGHSRYAAEGIVESDLRYASIAASDFNRLLEESSAFRTFVFSTLGIRFAELVQRVEEVSLERIDTRLAKFLLQHALPGNHTIQTTHQKIAAELGSAREVISRQLKSFEESGWVTLGRGHITILDTCGLRSLCADSVT
jgi:CRP/FNR family transcriptional regulator, anaerobic regulatory protein